MKKKVLKSLFRHNPETPEGKYLVMRRDGTVPPWPSFVLGGADPISPWALRVYAIVGLLMGLLHRDMARDVWRWAKEMDLWRRNNGHGDPGMGRHRKDDPTVVARMREGMSA